MVTSLIQPAYHQGFARHAGEAAKPHLWRGKVYHVEPALGPSGNTLYDICPRKTNTTLVATPTWTPGTRGYQIELNGSSQYFQTGVERIGNTGLFCDANESFSISAWYIVIGTEGTIMSRAGGTGTSRTFQVYIEGTTNMRSFIRGAGTLVSSSHSSNIWRNLTVTWDRTTARLYLNGLFLTDLSDIIGAAEESQNINFGSRTSGSFILQGNLGGCRIWDTRAISPNEIWELFINPWADLRLRRPVYKAPEVAAGVSPVYRRPYDNYMRNLITR